MVHFSKGGGGGGGDLVSSSEDFVQCNPPVLLSFGCGSWRSLVLRTRSRMALCAMLDARILDTWLARLCGRECCHP